MNAFARDVAAELISARSQHGKVTGAHDGYGRILEEVEEFWEEVRLKREQRQRTAEDLELCPYTQVEGSRP